MLTPTKRMCPEIDFLLVSKEITSTIHYQYCNAFFLFYLYLELHEDVWTKNIILKISIKQKYFLTNSAYTLLDISTLAGLSLIWLRKTLSDATIK